MNRPLVAVVMAGGTGTRLYPAARPDRPKQFLALGGDRSLLERTVDRVAFADETVVVTRAAHEAGVRERAPEATVLVEPEPKDTGPALVYAAHRARELYEDPVLLAVPSDHAVADRDGPGGSFAGVARAATRVAAETGGLVTVGVEPDRPATGYGYVEPGPWREFDWPDGAAGDGRGSEASDRPEGAPERYAPVAAFHEKPEAETAAAYVDAGHRWNTGVFAWTPAALLSAAAGSPLAPLVDALAEGDPAAGYAAVPAGSVDRAVMERADDAYLVPARFGWDDLGTWDAVGRALGGERGGGGDGRTPGGEGERDGEHGHHGEHGHDGEHDHDTETGTAPDGTKADDERRATTTDGPASDGAVVLGDGLAMDAPGTLVATDEDTHVAVAGVEDVVVAAYDDRVVVVPREEAGRVRDVVAALREEGRY